MPGGPAISRRCTAAVTGSSGKSAAARLPAAADRRAPARLPLPDRPSIAVLPFDNMSDDPDQEHFADGMSEDLITGLVPHPLAVRDRPQLDLRLQEPRRRCEAGRARTRRALRARRQRAPGRQAAARQRAAHRRDQPAVITGPNATTASSATSSPCRTKSPAASSPRSSRACWPRRAFAPFRDPRTISGAWELVARAQTHVWRLTRADYETAIGVLERAVEAYPDYAPARSLLAFLPGVCGAYGLDRSRSRDCSPAASTPFAPSRSTIAIRGGRSRSAIWAMMERRTEESIAAFRPRGRTQSEFRDGPWRSRPRPGVCGTGSRGDRAGGRRHQAQPAGSGRWRCFSAASRSLIMAPADMRKLVRYSDASCCGCARAFKARNACAVRVWPRPAKSKRPGKYLATIRLRAAATIARLDQSERSLPNARVDGAISGRHAESGADRGMRSGAGAYGDSALRYSAL